MLSCRGTEATKVLSRELKPCKQPRETLLLHKPHWKAISQYSNVFSFDQPYFLPFQNHRTVTPLADSSAYVQSHNFSLLTSSGSFAGFIVETHLILAHIHHTRGHCNTRIHE